MASWPMGNPTAAGWWSMCGTEKNPRSGSDCGDDVNQKKVLSEFQRCTVEHGSYVIQRVAECPELVLGKASLFPINHMPVDTLVEPAPALPEIFPGYVTERYRIRQFAKFVAQDGFVGAVHKSNALFDCGLESSFGRFFISCLFFVRHSSVSFLDFLFEGIPFFICLKILKSYEIGFHFVSRKTVVKIYHIIFFYPFPRLEEGRLIIRFPVSF